MRPRTLFNLFLLVLLLLLLSALRLQQLSIDENIAIAGSLAPGCQDACHWIGGGENWDCGGDWNACCCKLAKDKSICSGCGGGGGGDGDGGGGGGFRCGGNGQTCNNPDKCDVAGGCNPACCAYNTSCVNGKICDIPNGYCVSGYSSRGCGTSGKALKCVGNQCVWQICAAGEACTPQCSSHSDCEDSPPPPTPPPGGGDFCSTAGYSEGHRSDLPYVNPAGCTHSCHSSKRNYCCWDNNHNGVFDGNDTCSPGSTSELSCSGHTICNNTNSTQTYYYVWGSESPGKCGSGGYPLPGSGASSGTLTPGQCRSISANKCGQLEFQMGCGVCKDTGCGPDGEPTPTPPLTPTPTPTCTPSPSPTPTPTVTPTPTPTPTATPTPMETPTPTPTETVTPTPTPPPCWSRFKIFKYDDENGDGDHDGGEDGLAWDFEYRVNGGEWHDYSTRWWFGGWGGEVEVECDDRVEIKEVAREGWVPTTSTREEFNAPDNETREVYFGNREWEEGPTPTPKEHESWCVSLSASPTSGEAPLAVVFNGSGYDSEGDIREYEFDFGDGEKVTQNDSRVEHVYDDPGTYWASLRVKDTHDEWQNGSGDCRREIRVGREPEVLAAEAPPVQPPTGANTAITFSLILAGIAGLVLRVLPILL